VNETEQVTSRLGSLPTTALADVLAEVGFPDQTLPPQIAPLARGMAVAGPAFPIEGRPANLSRRDSVQRIVEMLSSVPAGHVAVYQPNDHSSGHVGDISVTALHARGCVGAVVDGGCRDVESLLELGFPVFCRYVTAQDAAGRWEVVEWGGRITIGPVEVEAGDYVVADANGVVVVPRAVGPDAAERAHALLDQEAQIRAEIASGSSPLEVFHKYVREGG
jgi:4-hydroxy-4-methyl-2-oxoglutarate aldolase